MPEGRRLAVVSDIHGNLPALEAVLAEIARAQVDMVVNLGDIVSGPLWPAETAARLRALGWPTIRGNHERQVLAADVAAMSATDAHARARLTASDLHWLASLPSELDLGDGLWCCHGTPTSDVQYLLETVTDDFGLAGSPGVRAATPAELAQRLTGCPARTLLCGHTHRPRIVQAAGIQVANPGSVGLPAYDDEHPHAHVIETGSPAARWARAALPHGSAEWLITLHDVAYDHEAAARQAERHGRGDWADALRTGRVGRHERDVTPAPQATAAIDDDRRGAG